MKYAHFFAEHEREALEAAFSKDSFSDIVRNDGHKPYKINAKKGNKMQQKEIIYNQFYALKIIK